MDKRKEDMSACGCGCGGDMSMHKEPSSHNSDNIHGTGYAAAAGMNEANASSMKSHSSDQFNDQGYVGGGAAIKGSSESIQKELKTVEGKTCKSGQSGKQSTESRSQSGRTASAGMDAASSSSMKGESPGYINDQDYMSSMKAIKEQLEPTRTKTNKLGQDGKTNIEGRSQIYQLKDEAYGNNQDEDMTRRLNQNVDDLTDM